MATAGFQSYPAESVLRRDQNWYRLCSETASAITARSRADADAGRSAVACDAKLSSCAREADFERRVQGRVNQNREIEIASPWSEELELCGAGVGDFQAEAFRPRTRWTGRG